MSSYFSRHQVTVSVLEFVFIYCDGYFSFWYCHVIYVPKKRDFFVESLVMIASLASYMCTTFTVLIYRLFRLVHK